MNTGDYIMKLVEAIEQRVDNIIKSRHLTQYEVAEQGGIPRSTISVIVNVKRKSVKIDTIYQICATLGISLKTFFDDPVFELVSD